MPLIRAVGRQLPARSDRLVVPRAHGGMGKVLMAAAPRISEKKSNQLNITIQFKSIQPIEDCFDLNTAFCPYDISTSTTIKENFNNDILFIVYSLV